MLRKSIHLVLAIALIVTAFSAGVASAASKPISFIVDQKTQTLKGAPFAQNGTAFIALSDVSKAFGATLSSNAKTKETTLRKGALSVTVKAGSKKAVVNKTSVNLSNPPVAKNGSLFVPVDFIAAAFGYQAKWDAANQRITVATNAKPVKPVVTEALKQKNTGLLVAEIGKPAPDLTLIRKLAEQGSDIENVIGWAFKYDRGVDVVSILIDAGADKQSAFHTAIMRRQKDVVEYLLGKGVALSKGEYEDALIYGIYSWNLMLYDQSGKKPIDRPVDLSLLQLLIDKGAAIKPIHLQLAIQSRQYDILKLLVDNGGDANGEGLKRFFTDNGMEFFSGIGSEKTIIEIKGSTMEKLVVMAVNIAIEVGTEENSFNDLELLLSKGASLKDVPEDRLKKLLLVAKSFKRDALIESLKQAGVQ